jgi:L,D-peptidoglycan transpeptidase YkuD (ErfK/YbiS/YcfS/YnhG family)
VDPWLPVRWLQIHNRDITSHSCHTSNMSALRVVSTTAVLVAIAAAAVAVFGVAIDESRADRPVADKTTPSGLTSTPPITRSATGTTSTPSSSAAAVPLATRAATAGSTALSTSPTSRAKPPASSTPPKSSSAPVVAAKPAAPAVKTSVAPRPPAAKPVVKAPPKPPAPAAGQRLPLGFSTGNATRVITVTTSSGSSTRSYATTATLQAWQKSGSGWVKWGPAILAHVGSAGMTTATSEDLSATPIGTFTLTQAFGAAANPGTPLPYFKTDSSDWWVSDRHSTYYNMHYRCAQQACPFKTGDGENLLSAGYVYTYAVVIDANRFPRAVPGNGSAFFLHVTDGSATAGCVAIPPANLVNIMRWLAPSTHPRILIGVT